MGKVRGAANRLEGPRQDLLQPAIAPGGLVRKARSAG